MIAAGAVTLFGGAVYAYQSSNIEVSHERLVLSKMKQRLRIVAVSDVHAPSFYSFTKDLIKMINNELPDIFILAGDIIDEQGHEGLVGMFKVVKARFAKIATLGNWEYCGRLDLAKLRGEYEKAGISLLVNSTFEVSGLTIIGLDDFLCGSPNYQILECIPNRLGPLLVISHCPESFDLLRFFPHSPLIILSGHTHGGQITPFGFVLSTPKGSGCYLRGWYHKGKHSMYVMRGIGTTPGIPLRIGARPEVLVLDLIGTDF